jgi:cytochrome c biogenesis protein CcmG/thiol:disulfide interchange protein DsbE
MEMNKYLSLVLISATFLFSSNILAEGKLFPIIEGKDFYTDEIVKVSDLLANKMSLVNVWASWCTTCRKEHQMIMNIAKTTDLQLIGIDFFDTRENGTKYLEELGNPFDEIVFDPRGSIGADLGVFATPGTFLINKNGEILSEHLGAMTQKIWDERFATFIPKLI